MLASNPASTLNQKPADLGIQNRFNPDESDSRMLGFRTSKGTQMPIQRLSIKNVTVLQNPGKRSEQLVWPHNAPQASVTITRVTMEPSSISKPHTHPRSEQIWIVEHGSGQFLGDGSQTGLKAGDIIRTPPGETHGVKNTGNEPLVYLAITTPPEDFTGAYQEKSSP